MFQYLIKLHYSQTVVNLVVMRVIVSVPYKITLLSNSWCRIIRDSRFQYLIKLHYSQTMYMDKVNSYLFQYLIKLHYSQT